MKNFPRQLLPLTICISLGLTATLSCQKKDSPPPDLTPVISHFNPTEAPEGGTVVITGRHFAEVKENNEVKFNGTKATVVEASATELTVTVPEKAGSGKITVTVGGQSVTSAANFTVNATAPAITAFSPEKGEPEVEVTITGSRFVSDSKVYFGGVEATAVTFVSNTTLKAKVPAEAITGNLKVTAGTLEAVSAADFKAAPRINNFTASAEEGQEVTITGANFSAVKGENTIVFDASQVAVAEILSASPTELKVKAPAAGSDGRIAVTVAGMTASAATDFTYKPTITGFSPDHGPRGTLVTISGKRMNGADLTVSINGANIAIQAYDATMVKFRIPNLDAVIGDQFTLSSNGFTLRSAASFVVTNILIPKSKSPQSSTVQRDRPVSFVLNNKIYIGWGRSHNGTYFTGKFVTYDPATDAWTETVQPPANIPGRYVAACVELGGMVYLGTGAIAGGSMDKKWYRLDVNNNNWQEMASFPTKVFTAGAGVVNNKILMGSGAGNDDGSGNNKVYEFNETGTGAWNLKATLPIEMYHITSFVLNDKLHIGLGYNQSAGGVRNNKIYSIDAQGMVGTIADFPGDATAAPTFILNGKAYLISTGDRKMYRYSPDGAGGPGTWEVVMSNLPYNLGIARVINGKIYLVNEFDQAFECVLDY